MISPESFSSIPKFARDFQAPKTTPEKENLEEKHEAKELSPEILENIMNKVQDIDTPGTAYTMLDKSVDYPDNTLLKDNFESLLQNGLLGTVTGAEGFATDRDITPEKWAKNVREKDQGVVFFNIVGRGRDFPGYENTEIDQAIGDVLDKDTVVLLFDTTNFKEEEPARRHDTFEQKTKTYRLDDPNIIPWYEEWKKGNISKEELQRQELMNENGEFLSDVQYGFVLSFRVAPRLFKGIVLKEVSGETADYQARVDEVVTAMRKTYKDQEELLVPIYDTEGNLLWPQEKSYTEVKDSAAAK
ncbi:hypothetical protein ACFL2B_02785 [Patescibacteria group bacterium]